MAIRAMLHPPIAIGVIPHHNGPVGRVLCVDAAILIGVQPPQIATQQFMAIQASVEIQIDAQQCLAWSDPLRGFKVSVVVQVKQDGAGSLRDGRALIGARVHRDGEHAQALRAIVVDLRGLPHILQPCDLGQFMLGLIALGQGLLMKLIDL